MAQLCAGTCRATLAWLVDKGAGYTSGSSLHIDIYICTLCIYPPGFCFFFFCSVSVLQIIAILRKKILI